MLILAVAYSSADTNLASRSPASSAMRWARVGAADNTTSFRRIGWSGGALSGT